MIQYIEAQITYPVMIFLSKKKLKKFGVELVFVVIILGGLIGLFYSLWFVDVHTFEIVVTPKHSSGPF
jgi:hypothetical protein